MTATQLEQFDNIRRAAERGLRMAQQSDQKPQGGFIDIFQHILDDLKRIEIEG